MCIAKVHACDLLVQMGDISMTIQAGVNSDKVKINSPKGLGSPAGILSRYLSICFSYTTRMAASFSE
jgi:hypothetical protein